MLKEFSPRTMVSYFRPGAGAGRFLTTMLIWGVAAGCFQSVMHNFLANVAHLDAAQRGELEFFREMPGLLLVFIIAAMHRMSEWRIMKVGTLVAMAGVAGLMFSSAIFPVMIFMVLWSVGEHILLPVRSTIAMEVAQPGQAGRSLGVMSGIFNAGNVTGCLIAAAVFFFGASFFSSENKAELYGIVWGFILVILGVAVICVIRRFKTSAPPEMKRPRLYFHRKYIKYYGLELFYGARKQIFMTFAPYVLILVYDFTPLNMAVLLGACALVNSFFGPVVGWITDRFGYRNVMIWDTVILAVVCLVYGFADQLFEKDVARAVVAVNFLFDAVISTTAMASSLYVKDISNSQEEVSSTITTGISVNHFVSVFAGLFGGWVWAFFGVSKLFIFAAIFSLCNSAFALIIPKPKHHLHSPPPDPANLLD